MKCPHCRAEVSQSQVSCSHCGFSTAAIRSFLGAEWVRLERITDTTQRLSLLDTRHLETVLDEFERHFPQCFMAAYLGALPPALTVADLGFWLINHGAFHTHQISRRNDFGIVLVLDPLHHNVAFTIGYALEPVLPEGLLTAILKRISPSLKKSDFTTAIQTAVSLVDKALRQHAKAEPRTHEQPPAIVGDASDLGLQTLRHGQGQTQGQTQTQGQSHTHHPAQPLRPHPRSHAPRTQN